MIKKGVILNSRQQLRPALCNSWVEQTKKAVEFCRNNQIKLISSFGMNSWELVTTLGRFYNLPMTLFIYGNSSTEINQLIDYYTYQFDLANSKVEFQKIICDSKVDKSELLQKRDLATIAEADILIPVSLRKNGRMIKLINNNSDKQLVDKFQTNYESRYEKLSYTIEPSNLNSEILSLESNYLIHWTRSSNSAWPSERLLDYYLSLVGNNQYPRTALDSLKNIIKCKTIYSSSKNISSNTNVVSFSNQTVEAMLPLFKWRARYHQMSFEPYGLAIKKELGIKLGIKPVRYFNKNIALDIKEDKPSWSSQSEGKISDWTKEMEYRFLGDFNFSELPPEDILLITRYKKEADLLYKQTGLKTISLANQ